jgi:hypothetical protein
VSFLVVVTAVAIQAAIGLPPERAFTPIEISSNVVTFMGFVWSLLMVRSCWGMPAARQAWWAAAIGMALLGVDEDVGALLGMDDAAAIGSSIAMSLVAAFYLFRACSRYAMRRSVKSAFWVGFYVQIAAQLVGWLAAIGPSPDRATQL